MILFLYIKIASYNVKQLSLTDTEKIVEVSYESEMISRVCVCSYKFLMKLLMVAFLPCNCIQKL